jgi:hypothetical protein
LRPVEANSLQDFISKTTRVKWTGGVTQAVECLFASTKRKEGREEREREREQELEQWKNQTMVLVRKINFSSIG